MKKKILYLFLFLIISGTVRIHAMISSPTPGPRFPLMMPNYRHIPSQNNQHVALRVQHNIQIEEQKSTMMVEYQPTRERQKRANEYIEKRTLYWEEKLLPIYRKILIEQGWSEEPIKKDVEKYARKHARADWQRYDWENQREIREKNAKEFLKYLYKKGDD